MSQAEEKKFLKLGVTQNFIVGYINNSHAENEKWEEAKTVVGNSY